jgi:glyoxylate reductase
MPHVPERLSIFAACRLPEEVKADLRRDCDIVFADEVARDVPILTMLCTCTQPIVMVTVQEPLDANAIAELPGSVRAIATYSVGHETLDPAARARGIAVLACPTCSAKQSPNRHAAAARCRAPRDREHQPDP